MCLDLDIVNREGVAQGSPPGHRDREGDTKNAMLRHFRGMPGESRCALDHNFRVSGVFGACSFVASSVLPACFARLSGILE